MGKGRSSRRKKKNNLKNIFIIIIILFFIVVGCFIYNKVVLPFWQEYQEKKAALEKILIEEEEEEKAEIVPEEELIEVTLYFADSQAMFLVPEKRQLPVSSSLAKQIIIELIKGPQTEGLYPTLPEGTALSELYISGNIAYVDLSEEIVKNHPGGSAGEIMSVYSLVNTLTEIESIKAVQILIAGQERESLAGHLDISRPLLRDEDWIKPPQSP